MKSLKLFLVLSLMVVTVTASSQHLLLGAAYSTNDTRIMEGDLYGVTKNGFVIGMGGSHATKTWFTHNQWQGNDFRDHNNNVAKNYPELTDPANAKHFRHSFVEDRGTLTGSVGYNIKKTIIVTDMGIAFQQEILLGNVGDYPVNAPSGWYWQSRTVGPKFLIGGTIMQVVKGRLGVLAGYNNVQKFRFGLMYRITPTKMFKD